MDGHQIDNVAWLAAAVRCRDLVRGKVNWMQYITERLIPHRREESKITIDNPFQLRGFAGAFRRNRVDPRIASEPFQRVATLLKQRGVLFRRLRYTVLAVVEYIDVARIARRGAVQWCDRPASDWERVCCSITPTRRTLRRRGGRGPRNRPGLWARCSSIYATICGINSPYTSVNRMFRPLNKYVSFV